MKKKLRIACLYLAILFVHDFAHGQNHAVSNSHNLNIIYFVPSDMDTLQNCKNRINGMMIQGQQFYNKWMQQWGYGNKTFGLNVDNDGLVKFTVIRGQYAMSYYPYDGGGAKIQTEVNAYFAANPTELRTSQHYLVFTPLSTSNPFYGLGRWCFVIDDPIIIDTNYLPNGGKSNYVGGLFHELGHGLNLPHDKETAADKSSYGTSLMGTGNSTYGKSKTYITPVDAAILNTSETFRTDFVDLYGGGNVYFSQLRINYENSAIKLNGKYASDKEISDIIVYADPAGTSDYDAVTFRASKIGTDSVSLEIPMAQLWKMDTTYSMRIKFVLKNGSVITPNTYTFEVHNGIPQLSIDYKDGVRDEGLLPIADTYIRDGSSYRNVNYSADTLLVAKPDPVSSYKREFFLKFRLSQYRGDLSKVNSVRLGVCVNSCGSDAAYNTYSVRLMKNEGWDESNANALTWTKWNSTTGDGDSITGLLGKSRGWLYWDLSVASVLDKINRGDSVICFHILGNGVTGHTQNSTLNVYSKESSDSTLYPTLVFTEQDMADNESTLPIKFGNVTATKLVNNTISVNWISQLEQNVQKYVVQRSQDGLLFESIGVQLHARNDTSYLSSYSFIDMSPLIGQNTYRIMAVDLDGKIEYSPIALVNVDMEKAKNIVSPNPVKRGGIFTIRNEKARSFEIFTSMGQTIVKNKMTNSVDVDTTKLASGLYFIRLYDTQSKSIGVAKIIVE